MSRFVILARVCMLVNNGIVMGRFERVRCEFPRHPRRASSRLGV
jgi:hypothetical protein